MQLSENARTVLERRYLKRKDGRVIETPEDMLRRVAANIAEVEGQWDPSKIQEMEEKFLTSWTTANSCPTARHS